MSFQRRPPPLDLKSDTSPTRVGGLGLRAKSAATLPTGTGKAAAAAAERASRGGSAAASLAGVDLEEELEHVHMELRTFLNKKRARKAGVAGVAQQEGTPGSASKGGQVCVRHRRFLLASDGMTPMFGNTGPQQLVAVGQVAPAGAAAASPVFEHGLSSEIMSRSAPGSMLVVWKIPDAISAISWYCGTKSLAAATLNL